MQLHISRKLIYTIGALAVLGIGSYFYFGQGKDPGSTLTIVPGDFREEVRVSGTVTATKDVALGFAASGRISHVYASVGQHVAAGTILAENENGDLVAALLQKQSALAQATANLASLEAGTRPEEIAVAAAAVTSAQSSLVDAILSAYTTADDAVHNKVDLFFSNPRTDPKLTFSLANMALKTTVERDRASVESVFSNWSALVSRLSNADAADSAVRAQGYLSTVVTLLADANSAINQGVPDPTTSAATLSSYASTLATGRASVNAAAASLTSDTAVLDSASKTLALKQAGATIDDIKAQQAAVAAAQADVENAQAALVKTRVVAPFGGTVTRMDAKVGEIVSPSTSEIGMQSDGIFQIETYVPEVAIARIAVGNPATTTLDAYGSAVPFASVVIAVDPAETLKDGVPTYKTTLAFRQADPRIRSGMTADVVMQTGILHDAIVIPAGAIGTRDGQMYVSVLADKKVVSRPVTTGPAPMLGQAEILSGLSRGDVILLTPAP
jgi:HlyD family secretion protein